MKLYIVGHVSDGGWEFAGVFDSAEQAEAQCHDATYFVGPVVLNQEIPQVSMDWPGAYYPKAQPVWGGAQCSPVTE
jgi:hypothetical protein